MSTPVVMRGCLIEARDVVKSFGQTPALPGASVAVAQGEIMGIGLVIAFGVITVTLPLLRRMTTPGNVRFE